MHYSLKNEKKQKPFIPDNCKTYNMNDNPKTNILMLENIIQKRVTILEYFMHIYFIHIFSDYCSYI